jgi:prophage maintenance system killer protein
LELNGLRLTVPNKAVVKFAGQVAIDEFDLSEPAKWIRKNTGRAKTNKSKSQG